MSTGNVWQWTQMEVINVTALEPNLSGHSARLEVGQIMHFIVILNKEGNAMLCYMLCAICYAICYAIYYAICYMLYAICYMLYAICYMLYAICYAICYMLCCATLRCAVLCLTQLMTVKFMNDFIRWEVLEKTLNVISAET